MKKKEETVHIAFRSKETGKYLFHVRWPLEKFKAIEKAAEQEGISVEQFILNAITEFTKNVGE